MGRTAETCFFFGLFLFLFHFLFFGNKDVPDSEIRMSSLLAGWSLILFWLDNVYIHIQLSYEGLASMS